VFITYNLYHSDIIVSRATLLATGGAIGTAAAESTDAPWILIGWGNHEFGRRPRNMLLRMLNGVRHLLLPAGSVVRIIGLADPTVIVPEFDAVREIEAPAMDRARLSRRLDSALGPPGVVDPVPADVTTRPWERFYVSREPYFLLHQSNNWVGQVLRAAGARTTPALDILPVFLVLDLKLHHQVGGSLPRRPSAAP
jgi:hypothetical protein